MAAVFCKIDQQIGAGHWHVMGDDAMKSTGIVRKVDELGRIVLPIELRRTLDIAEKDSLEIYVDGAAIVLRKYEPSCIFCQSATDIVSFNGKNICKKCLDDIIKLR